MCTSSLPTIYPIYVQFPLEKVQSFWKTCIFLFRYDKSGILIKIVSLLIQLLTFIGSGILSKPNENNHFGDKIKVLNMEAQNQVLPIPSYK